ADGVAPHSSEFSRGPLSIHSTASPTVPISPMKTTRSELDQCWSVDGTGRKESPVRFLPRLGIEARYFLCRESSPVQKLVSLFRKNKGNSPFKQWAIIIF